MYVINIRQGQYQLAVNNNNAAGLLGLEGILVAASVRPITMPKGWGNYFPGNITLNGLGLEKYGGFPGTKWILSWAHRRHVAYLMTTYCGGAYSGLVTVKTSTDALDGNGDPAFSTFNAVLRLPKLNELTWSGNKCKQYELTFSRMVAI